ncbi:MAG TPA: hypothetical protein VFX20_18255 [Steroidobacteraceae bacterium]|nr:hypothetical protein [Steroidobacteraceae bacterium]
MKPRQTPEKRMPGEPAKTARWAAWRAARNRAIADPPRLKTCKSKASGDAKSEERNT